MSIDPTFRTPGAYRVLFKPVEITAAQWDGTAEGAIPIINWVLAGDGAANYWGPGEWDQEAPYATYIVIKTLEGNMLASPGDWIIRGVQGEFYPCKPDIFAATYSPAGESAVPEVDDVVDAEVEEDWTILRKAADAILHSGYDPTTLTTVLDVADYLTGQAGRIEADHRAAQEKAAQDVAREALIVKAAKALAFAGERNDSGVSSDELWSNYLTPSTRERYLAQAHALADAGLLAEAGEAS